MTNPGLQINENRAFQTGSWHFQRIAWVLLAVLVLAAGLGLTGGDGRFSHGRAGGLAFRVEYPLVMRQQTEAEMTISVASLRPDTLLHFGTAFQDNFVVRSMTPAPTEEFATASGVAYRFSLAGEGSKTVRIIVTSDKPGRIDYSIVADGHLAMVSTVVLP